MHTTITPPKLLHNLTQQVNARKTAKLRDPDAAPTKKKGLRDLAMDDSGYESDEDDSGSAWGPLVFLAIAVTIALWIYSDANARKAKRGAPPAHDAAEL